MSLELLVITVLVKLANMNSVIGSHEPVHVRVGEDAILPCHLEPPFDVNRLTVEWRWNGKYVYIYRSEEPDLVNQDELFRDRTSLFPEEMKKGNISLKVTKVTEVHAGSYSCFVPQLHSQVRKDKVILIVDPVEKNKDENQIKGGHTGTVAVVLLLVLIAVVALRRWCVRRRRRRANGGNVI